MSTQPIDHNAKLEAVHNLEALRLEVVVTCVNFSAILDVALRLNMPHVDTMIVVTSHADTASHVVADKHGAICVQTDLFGKNGRGFNKGAAINAGFDRFQYHGWRMHLDADIVLPDNFRRLLFNHTHLDRSCLYGADRIDVIGRDELKEVVNFRHPQHGNSVFLHPKSDRAISPRYVDPLRGYCPLGFLQLWHASAQKPYPHSLGNASHDDIAFSALWPEANRRQLPTAICYHLCSSEPYLGEHWDGIKEQKKF